MKSSKTLSQDCCVLASMTLADIVRSGVAPIACDHCRHDRETVTKNHKNHKDYARFWCALCTPEVRGPRQRIRMGMKPDMSALRYDQARLSPAPSGCGCAYWGDHLHTGPHDKKCRL